jgi:hypothetical protein
VDDDVKFVDALRLPVHAATTRQLFLGHVPPR